MEKMIDTEIYTKEGLIALLEHVMKEGVYTISFPPNSGYKQFAVCVHEEEEEE